MKIKHLLLIFLPAIALLIIIFFVRVVQYEPLNPKISASENKDASAIPIFPEDPILGNKKAPTAVIVFADFGCEECKNEYAILRDLLITYPEKVKVIWKGLPVTKFPYDSELANLYGFCANKQNKFAEMADVLFVNQLSLTEDTLKNLSEEVGLNTKTLASCVQSQESKTALQKTKDLAEILKIQAVPAVFLNNNQIPAPKSIEEWKTALSL